MLPTFATTLSRHKTRKNQAQHLFEQSATPLLSKVFTGYKKKKTYSLDIIQYNYDFYFILAHLHLECIFLLQQQMPKAQGRHLHHNSHEADTVKKVVSTRKSKASSLTPTDF